MKGATTAPDDVGRYIGAVRDALADLPADERDDLLLEVEASIADAAGDSDAPVAARLGPPEEFAAELREAAGFHVASTAQRAERGGLRSLAGRAARHPAWRRILSLARDLAPIWWVARGYAVVGILAVWLGTGWAERYPFVPRVNGSAALGVALVALGVAASVAVGLFTRRREIRSRLAVVANLALVAALWAVLVEVDNATWGSPQAVGFVEAPTDGLALDGVPITNIYPYGRNGQLLHDVLLYDQAGTPLAVPGNQDVDPNRRFVVGKNGTALLNVFPIRYFQPGTHTVAHPDAAPAVNVPVVVTAPLIRPESKRANARREQP
jgi:hypothetical protein